MCIVLAYMMALFMSILPLVTQKSTSRTGHGGAEMRDEGHGKKKLMKTCEQKATFH